MSDFRISLYPPYGKRHIALLAVVTLFFSIFLLYVLDAKSDKTPTEVAELAADELRQGFQDPIAKVQRQQTAAAWVQDKFVILDIRPEEEFAQRHITGAQNAPVADLEKAVLHPDVHMVLYGDDRDELTQAVDILRRKNIRYLYILNDSFEELEQQGYTLTEASTAEANQEIE